ncbi:MAG: phage major capsid protein [Ignavibacteria bacterium]|nr:phage major capsid protein [Ignavibacteria bacterium]
MSLENINMEEFRTIITSTVDEAIKASGIDKIDVKHAKLPGAEDVPTENLSPLEAKNTKFKKFLSGVMQKAYNLEGNSAQGGYLVPVEFMNQVSTLLKDYGLFRKFATVINMNSKTMTMPRLLSQATASWVNENTAKSVANNTFDQVTFTRHTLAKISPVSRELLQDSGIDLVSFLAEIAANSFAKAEDEAGFTGSGSPITGLTNASGTNEVVLSGTLAASLTYAKLLEMITGIPSVATQGSAWYMHRSVFDNILSLEDASDRLIFSTVPDMNAPSLLGYPVRLTDAMTADSVTAVDTPYIVFGNLKYSTLANREDMRIDVADQATIEGNSLFEKNLLAFRFEESLDIQIVQPTAFSILRSAAA